MKLSNIRTAVVGTPWRNLTVVELTTDEGLTGVGEARMLGHTDALLGYLAEAWPNHVRGADPFNIESLVSRMYRRDIARAGEIAMSGIATIELACWDIVGQALGQPIYRLLGGNVRDGIKAYANGWYQVDRTPSEFAAAAKAVVEHGYQALKLDPFGEGFYELDHAATRLSLELVEAVRDAIGPGTELMIEMHGRFSASTAIQLARALERFAPAWLEEPVPPDNLTELAAVARATNLPVAAGERIHSRFEFKELLDRRAAAVIQPDITHFGGLMETKKLAAQADLSYVLMAPHNVGGPISTAAALHLAACTTNFKIQEHFNDFADAYVKQIAPGNPEVIDGYFALPTGTGLGVKLDWDAIAEHPRQRAKFDLFEADWHLRRGSE